VNTSACDYYVELTAKSRLRQGALRLRRLRLRHFAKCAKLVRRAHEAHEDGAAHETLADANEGADGGGERTRGQGSRNDAAKKGVHGR
jgi:hypothetical protein